MNTATHTAPASAGFELRFQSLFREGRGLAFPCDARGQVELARLPDKARCNFLLAQALVGREFAVPVTLATLPH